MFGGGGLVAVARVLFHVDTGELTPGLVEAERQVNHSSKQMERDMGAVTRGATAASGAFSHLGRTVAFASTSFLGGYGFVAVVKQSVNAASDLHEQLNKVDVVFGKSAGSVKEWSRESATAMGLARGETLKYAATFGNLLKPMGIVPAQAAEISKGVVKLAADMASFNNANPEDVLQALQSGFAGQVRPLREYGVFLDQTRIKAEALRLGLVKAAVDQSKIADDQTKIALAQHAISKATEEHGSKSAEAARALTQLHAAERQLDKDMAGNVGSLTAAQKALATYNLILHDTKDAQGDFHRTSDGLANQTRILRAQLVDLEETVGTELLPVVTHLIHELNDWIEHAQRTGEVHRDVQKILRETSDIVHALWSVIHAGQPIISETNDLLGGTRHSVELLGSAMVAFKVKGAAAAVVGLNNVGTAARDAETKTAALRTALGSLLTLGLITVGIEVLIHYKEIGKLLGLPGLTGGDSFNGNPQQPGSSPLSQITGKRLKLAQEVRSLRGKGLSDAAIQERLFKQLGNGDGSDLTVAQAFFDANQLSKMKTKGTSSIAAPSVAPTANRAGAPLHSGVTDFVTQIEQVAGEHLTITTGTAHNKYVAGEPGVVSQHWTGDAADIGGFNGSPGHADPRLTKLGQAALIAAGADPTWALKQKGGVYNINGKQIIFNSNVGGNHWNHLHVGVSPAGTKNSASPTPDTSGTQNGSSGSTPAGGSSGDPFVEDPTKKGAKLVNIPAALQQAYSRAKATPGSGDDITALTKEIDWVTSQLKSPHLTAAKRTALTKEYGGLQAKLNTLVETAAATNAKQMATVPGLAGVLQQFQNLQSGNVFKQVNVKGLGKFLMPMTPTIADWKALQAALALKLKAARKRQAALKQSLAKAKKVKHKDPKIIATIQSALNGLNQQISELSQDIGLTYSAILELSQAANDQAQQQANEAEQAAADANSGAGSVPDALSVNVAKAEYAGDVAGEIGALNAEKAFLLNELTTGKVVGADGKTYDLTDAGRISIYNALNQLNQTIASLSQTSDTGSSASGGSGLNAATAAAAAGDGGLNAFLQAIQSLRRTQADNIIGRALGGSTITVINNFQSGPDDPHLFTQGLQFELQTLVG